MPIARVLHVQSNAVLLKTRHYVITSRRNRSKKDYSSVQFL